ncbi:M14 family metallocarboxypeptidase [Bacillus sp. RO1]|uniref:M14 family metallocarboxypeptidase n=1 Tax=Bacillus sp. RO1 TaxID=2722703 RepID=UPI0014569EB4|nr:M14 family metallocarboxypeptidase [Bacillus sp. RO1]NLP52719.1 hypothetical protein [Bacillus sp. RO1]
MKKILVSLLSILIVFTSFSPYLVTAEGEKQEQESITRIQLLSEVEVFAEDGDVPIGAISEEAVIYALIIGDDQLKIQWGDGEAIIHSSDYEVLNNPEDLIDEPIEFLPNDEVDLSSDGYIYALHGLEGEEKPAHIATILAESNYPVMIKEDITYVMVGGVIGELSMNPPEDPGSKGEESATESDQEDVETDSEQEEAEETPKEELTPADSDGEKQPDLTVDNTDKGKLDEETVEDTSSSNQVLDVGLVKEFSSTDKYFKAVQANVHIYQNIDGKLVAVGYVFQGQEYERIRDYGSWHEVKFGNGKGYVWKAATEPSDGTSIQNKSSKVSSSKTITMTQNLQVYDNSQGPLVPFASIQKGATINIVRKMGSWYEVNFSGREGYIYHTGVRESFVASDKYFKVMQDNVHVYQNVNGKLVTRGYLEKDQEYERVRDYGSWHEIRIGNSLAYVWKEATNPSTGSSINNKSTRENSSQTIRIIQNLQVYDNSAGPLVPFGRIDAGQNIHIVRKMGSWYEINYAGRFGYIYYTGVQVDFSASDKYFQPTQDNVLVNMKVDGKLTGVGRLIKGQEYQRIRDYGSWHEIKMGDDVGYVWKEATIPSSGSSISQSLQTKQDTRVKVQITGPLTVYDNSSGKLVSFGTFSQPVSISVVSDYGSWYEINYAGRKGFISKNSVEMKPFKLVNPRQNYSYEQMVSDLHSLKVMYPDLIQLITIGKSVDGRDIYAVRLGKGQTEILLSGSQHAREHMTTNLLMEMLETYTTSMHTATSFAGFNTKSVLQNTSIWFVPMINPDGVMLVQQGAKSAKNPQQVLSINKNNPDFSAWKANIRGVDLNRQYPANWNRIDSPSAPSHKNYKGKSPLSEPEALAMYRFVLSRDFKTLMDYHSSGELIYWYYEQSGAQYDRDYKLAQDMARITGYNAVDPRLTPGDGAFSDWFTMHYKRPGFTPEISPYVYEKPVPIGNFNTIWSQNKSIGLFLADEAYKNRNTR